MIFKTLWFSHFNGAIEIFKKNPIFGSGFKSYRFKCRKIINPREKNIICTNHPHNIYFEIISDTGLIGIFLLILFVSNILYDFYKSKLFLNHSSNIIFCLLLSFLFPLKPTGSFFSTNYAFMFWIIMSFLIKDIYFRNYEKK